MSTYKSNRKICLSDFWFSNGTFVVRLVRSWYVQKRATYHVLASKINASSRLVRLVRSKHTHLYIYFLSLAEKIVERARAYRDKKTTYQTYQTYQM